MSEPSLIGQAVGNYTITGLLGSGGMGAVYEAVHPGIGRKAAIKILFPTLTQDPELLARFFNEARAAHAIGHPCIVDVFDMGRLEDGSPYIVMEKLEGESLGSRLRRQGALPVDFVLNVAEQAAGALAAAHELGIVHRDLKPDNLFLVPDRQSPQRERLKVLDFGIAKLGGGSLGADARTRTGTIMGTPTYMSPEQCRGTRDVDHRSDLYSLGVILFEMLCGEPPFRSSGFGELAFMHIGQAPPLPRSLRPDLPQSVEGIVVTLLQKAPDHRFASAGALEAAVREAATGAPIFSSGSTMVLPPAGAGGTRLLTKTDAGVPQTTLTAAAGDREDSRQAPPRKTRMRVAGALAIVVLAGAVVWGIRPILSRSDQSVQKAVQEVNIEIRSNPIGASVRDSATEELLGTTPLRLTRPRSARSLSLRLDKPPHAPVQVTVGLDRDGRVVTNLPPPPPAEPQPEDLERQQQVETTPNGMPAQRSLSTKPPETSKSNVRRGAGRAARGRAASAPQEPVEL